MFERPYPYQNPYYNYAYYQYPSYHEWHYPAAPPPNPAYMPTPFEQFAKPKQPDNWYPSAQPNTPFYTPQNPDAKSGLLAYFQDNNGQMDLDKMLSTVGQMANTVQQVSPVVKQIGSIVKSFR